MRVDAAIGLGLVAVLTAIPVWGSGYQVSFLLQFLEMVVLAQSWNLISGITGYVSFGHAAFFGVGAYTAAILLPQGVNWIAAMVAGAGIAALVALPLGILTLRLRGPYFAIVMLGLNEVARIIATLWVDLTKGGDGITLNPALLPAMTAEYWAMLILAILATGLTAWVLRSRFGLELRAIREEESAAEMVGVNTLRSKVVVFLLSAVLPGAVGGLHALYVSFIDPSSVFAPEWNIQMIVMTLLGGRGTLWGSVLGAGIVSWSRELLWATFPAIHAALMGLLTIGVVLFLPEGLTSLMTRRRRFRPDQDSIEGVWGGSSPPAG